MKITKRILAALFAFALVAALIAVSVSATEYVTEPVNETSEGSGIYYLCLSTGQAVRIAGSDYDDPDGEYTGFLLSLRDFIPESGHDYSSDGSCFIVSDSSWEFDSYVTLIASSPGSSYYYYTIRGVSYKLFVYVYDEMDLSDVSPTIKEVYYSWGQLDKVVSVDTDQIYLDGYDKGHNEGYQSGKAAGYSDGKNDGYSDGYTVGYNKGINDNDAYDMGYKDGFNSVIQVSDGNAVSGFFSGIFGAFYDGYDIIANGISINGVSVGTVISTFIIIVVIVAGICIGIKFFK